MGVQDPFWMRVKGNHQGLPVFPMGFVNEFLKYWDVTQMDAVEVAYCYERIPEFGGYVI